MKTSTITRTQKITATAAKSPLPEGATELVIKDDTLTGFRLRITPRARSYAYAGRVAGGGRRTVKLGDAASLTATEARKLAQDIRNQFLRGEDIQKREPKTITFSTAYETRRKLWEAGGLRQQKKAPSPATVVHARSDITRALGHMGNLPVKDVTLDVARAFVTELENEDVGNDAKRRAMGEASRVMDFATGRGWADGNPFKLLTNFTSAPARDRVLSVDDVHRLWKAAGEMGRTSAFIRFLIAQPVRLSCAANLRWRDVDLHAGVIVLPADMIGNKAKIEFSIALTGTARDVLEGVTRRGPDDFVFEGRTAESRVWWDHARQEAFAALHGVPDVRLHDLRTAFSTIIGDRYEDADTDALELLLAHKRKGVQAKYQRSFRLDAQRRVGALWDRVLSAGETDNVVRLTSA